MHTKKETKAPVKVKKQSRTKNTLNNLLTGFACEFYIYILNFVSRTVFINTLGKEYLGISGLFSNILLMLSLSDLGIYAAINYRLYKSLAEGNQEKLREILGYFKKVYRIIGWCILAIGACVIPFLKYLIKNYETLNELGISAPLVFVIQLLQSASSYWFFAYKTSIVKADQKEYYINIVSYGTTTLTYAAQIFVLWLTKDYLAYIVVAVIASIFQNFVYAKIADHFYPFINEKARNELPAEEKKAIFADCRAITLYQLSAVVLKATDNLVLSAFIGLEIVGLYSNYLMIYNMVKKIIKKIIRAAQASIGNVFANADSETKYDYFRILNFCTALLVGVMSVTLVVVLDEFIVTWIGTEYLIQMPFSVLIALEVYTIGLKLHLEVMRETLGLFQKIKWRAVASVVLNLVISIMLVQRIGIYGVICGTLISEWLTTFTVDPYMVCKYGLQNANNTAKYYLINIAYFVELVIVYYISHRLCSLVDMKNAWITLVLHAVITVCVSSCIMLLLNWSSQERKRVMNIARNFFVK